ncbi:hypothetical protein LAJ19_15830 (plasmid) [Deinococcus taeanensis]|uniref:hypothetical protein n=1 Tax=Deinococcus taeanensis TaxID=2737050 RepID=UPI001CDCF9D4|nr:hypothetical protein [Deinococcus taeanensis]UBV44636.1 hypothetical protein LAJ19_15830 [Deinococcus taeanensis]
MHAALDPQGSAASVLWQTERGEHRRAKETLQTDAGSAAPSPRAFGKWRRLLGVTRRKVSAAMAVFWQRQWPESEELVEQWHLWALHNH